MQNAILVREGPNQSDQRDEPLVTDRFLRIQSVCDQIGLGKTWIYEAIDRGDFPAPVKIKNARVNVWSARAIGAWQNRQLEGEAA